MTKPKVYVHLIQHGQHNYSAIQFSKDQNYDPKNADESEKVRCKSLRDPGLTPHGINEALDLRHHFPYMDEITHILTSPLRRTLQTMFLAFEPAIKRGIKPIALDILREKGFGPNHFGSDLPSLLAEFGDLGESVLTTEIEPGWEIPQPVRSPMELSRRGNLVLRRLRELANLAKMPESDLNQARKDFKELDSDTWSPFNMWLMKYDFPQLREGKDVHIAVVTHRNFLEWMTYGEGVLFDNAEFRTFMFQGEEEWGPDPKVDQSLNLVELKESKDRPDAWLCEADLAEKLRMRERNGGAEVDVERDILL